MLVSQRALGISLAIQNDLIVQSSWVEFLKDIKAVVETNKIVVDFLSIQHWVGESRNLVGSPFLIH